MANYKPGQKVVFIADSPIPTLGSSNELICPKINSICIIKHQILDGQQYWCLEGFEKDKLGNIQWFGYDCLRPLIYDKSVIKELVKNFREITESSDQPLRELQQLEILNN